MKLTENIQFLVMFFFILIKEFYCKNQNRFDLRNKECKNSICKKQDQDESCIYICISKKCYQEIYKNYLFELGESNYDKKLEFEKCFYKN